MRTIVITYCLLTFAFTGGCVLLLYAVGWPGSLWADIVLLAALCNAAFVWMALRRAPGGLMVGAGIAYAVVQAVLAWQSDMWAQIGTMSVLVFVLFAVKGAMLVFAGLEARREAE